MLLNRKDAKVPQDWVAILMVLTLFTIPLSSSLKSIFFVITLGLILCTKEYRQQWPKLKALASCWSSLVFFAFALLACAWTEASAKEWLLGLEKYAKLLYLPLLILGFSKATTRTRALQAFVAAMLLTCLLSIAKSCHWIFLADLDPGRVFRNHIMTSYMMSLAAYIAAYFAFQARGKIRLAYMALTGLLSFQVLFINTGRTGYVVFLILMCLFFMQFFSLRRALIGIFLGLIALVCLYTFYNPLHLRLQELYDNWLLYQQQPNTSLGYRFQFHSYAHKLFAEAPLLGHGMGSFTHLFKLDQPVPSWQENLLEPHSQYWLIASEFGLLGLGLFALWMATLCYDSCKSAAMRPIAIAVLIPFLLGNLSDSLLYYSGTGYLFICFMALCLGSKLEEGSR